MSIQDEDIGNEKDKSWLGYALSSGFVLLVISIQIIFFRGDYIFWVPYPILSPLSGDQISFLTFRTLGAFLCGTGFYLALYRGMRALGFTIKDYKAVKFLVWGCLVAIMDVVQRWVIFGVNEVWSFFWNGIRLLVFLWPSFSIIVFSFLFFFVVRKLLRNRDIAS